MKSTSKVLFPAAVLAVTTCGILLSSSPAGAWERHQSLMQSIINGLPAETRLKLQEKISAPCPPEDNAKYDELAQLMFLNPHASVRPTALEACGRHLPTSAEEILLSPAVDDPDHGMDQDLDDIPGNPYDPDGYRKWMGGVKGPTGKGFRHMYFGGWNPAKPITTFQIPLHALGYAPKRAEIIATEAHSLLRQKKNPATDPAWGFRLLAWSMHYIQDLAQPFHSVQIVSLSMVPWHVLLTEMIHGPGAAFGALVKETTRTIGNYHWAFEDYTLYRINDGATSPFAECLLHPAPSPDLTEAATPELLARAVAKRSVDLAPEVGNAELAFIGRGVMDRKVDLAHSIGSLSYADLSNRPDLAAERTRLHEVTCIALGNAVNASRKLIDWALQP